MRGHPVHDHPDPGAVQGVDQEPEVVGGAEPRRRGVVGRHLVAPGPAERVLGHRQQFHVGEAVGDNVFGELRRQFAVAQPGPPRPQVHLVGAHRLEHRVARPAPDHPGVVVPGVVRDEHLRGGVRGHFGGERERVGPVGDGPVGAVDAELVVRAGAQAGPEQLPHSRGAQRPHRGVVAGPAVEVADQVDALGVGGPHRERHPLDHPVGGGERARVCAEDLPQPFVAALGEQVQIHLAEGGQEAVAVGGGDGVARVADLQPVIGQVGERHRDGEQPGLKVRQRELLPADQRRHRFRTRAQRPDDGVVPNGLVEVLVGAQDGVRVVVDPGQQPGGVAWVRRQVRAGQAHRGITPGAAAGRAPRPGSVAGPGCAPPPWPAPGARSWTAPTGTPPR